MKRIMSLLAPLWHRGTGRDAAGIGENLVRVSVGLEDVEDIYRDLARGLDALTTG